MLTHADKPYHKDLSKILTNDLFIPIIVLLYFKYKQVYKHALQLYKLFNSNTMSDDWISLNIQQNFNRRNEHIQIYNESNYKVGQNLLVNRFKTLNNKINYSWFHESFESFKVKCKNLFL